MTQPLHSPETADVNDEQVAPEAAEETAESATPPAAAAPASESQKAVRSETVRSETRRDMPSEAPRRSPLPQAAKPQPSWVLSATGEHLTREELLTRYRRQRALPDDPFDTVARPAPAPARRDRMPVEPRPAARFIERPPTEPAAAQPAPPQKRSFTLGQTFTIAAAMALLAGGGAGVLSAKLMGQSAHEPAQPLATAPAAEAVTAEPAQQLQLAAAGAARTTIIDKKPVSTATLQVADVTGETNSFIPLALHAAPAGLDQDMLLKISGVPEGAYLTSGHRQDDQVWALSLAEVKGVKLVVPEADGPQIDLAVAAFESKTGELAAPVKTMTVALSDVVVKPTSAPPEQDSAAGPAAERKSALPGADAATLPLPIPPPQSIKVALGSTDMPETQQMISEADSLFKGGDVREARRGYERAWGTDGSAAAAFGLARSYDPVVLSGLALKNAKPDREQAIQWYQRAASAGNPEAAEAIVRLQLKP